jgi:hypothetical protein
MRCDLTRPLYQGADGQDGVTDEQVVGRDKAAEVSLAAYSKNTWSPSAIWTKKCPRRQLLLQAPTRLVTLELVVKRLDHRIRAVAQRLAWPSRGAHRSTCRRDQNQLWS